MKLAFISAEDQLDMLESIACATGSKCYDSIRSEMADIFRKQYPRNIYDMDYEEIPENSLADFIAWVEEDDDDE